MGIMIRIKCKTCNASNEMNLGVGMMYSPSNVFEHSAGQMLRELVEDDAITDKALSLLSTECGKPGDYGNAAYFCPVCRDAKQKFFFQIIEQSSDGDEKLKYEPEYVCSICGNVLMHISLGWGEGSKELERKLRDSGWRCRKCESEDIQCEDFGHWD